MQNLSPLPEKAPQLSLYTVYEDKFQFVGLFAIMNVGADMIRPRREILRIRIRFRRIRIIVPPGD